MNSDVSTSEYEDEGEGQPLLRRVRKKTKLELLEEKVERDRGIRNTEKLGTLEIEFIYPSESIRERMSHLAKEILYHTMTMKAIWLGCWTIFVYTLLATIFWAVLIPARGTVAQCQLCPFPSLMDLWFWSYGRMVGIDGKFDAIGTGAEVIALIEGFVAMLAGALLTGIFYSRIALPVHPFIFTSNIAICMVNGKRTMQMRVANRRTHADTDRVEFSVSALKNFTSAEGHKITRGVAMPLLRESHMKLRAYPFTVQSVIEPGHPLYGLNSLEDMQRAQLRIMVNVSGSDLIQQSDVFADIWYEPSQIHLGYRFRDQFSEIVDAVTGETKRTVDFRMFDKVVRDPHWVPMTAEEEEGDVQDAVK